MKNKDSGQQYLPPTDRRVLAFDDNRLIVTVFGQHDRHLARLEQQLDVILINRGNKVMIEGSVPRCETAACVLEELYDLARRGYPLELGDVDGVIRMIQGQSPGGCRPRVDDRADPAAIPGGIPGAIPGAVFPESVFLRSVLGSVPGSTPGASSCPSPALSASPTPPETVPSNRQGNRDASRPITIKTRKKTILPRSPGQADYMQKLASREMVFGIGPAGTGKTYLAVAMAVAKMMADEIDRIILSRPAVEAGESLGFLPGDLKEKIAPYLRPLYDALDDMMPTEQVEKRITSGQIEIAPLAYMRGRTLSNAFVILDEAQNTTPMQMKMFLTRFGENCRMVVCGDPSQVDLPPGTPSGLSHALDLLHSFREIGVTRFMAEDVVRHSLVGKIVHAYEAAEHNRTGPARQAKE